MHFRELQRSIIMNNFPRFRYLLVTNTLERGSPILELNKCNSNKETMVTVLPSRSVTEIEFKVLAVGVKKFQSKILNRGEPFFSRRGDGAISYSISFSDEELLSRIIIDPHFTLRLLNARKQIVPKIFDFLNKFRLETSHEFSLSNPNDPDRIRWGTLASDMFMTAIPFLMTDEALLREAELIILRRLPPKRAWDVLTSNLVSPYARDVVAGLLPKLPDTKEWTWPPPPCFTLAMCHPVIEPSASWYENYFDDLGQYERTILSLMPTVLQFSEETHYILGVLFRVGNHLWSESESKTFVESPQISNSLFTF